MKWDSARYVWNAGIAQVATHGPHVMMSPEEYYAQAERVFVKQTYDRLLPGSIIWINCQLLYRFCEEVLPGLDVPVVLVIADGDNSFPSDCATNQEGHVFGTFDTDALVGHSCIKHVFAQNCDYDGSYPEKVTHIPIGLDLHTIAYRRGGWREPQATPEQQCEWLDTMVSQRRLGKTRICVDFHHSDTMHGGFRRYLQHGEDRKSIFEKLSSTGLIDHGDFLRRSELWQKKAEYVFTVSPHGNGMDCHRTWEDLLLGCFPIVKTSPLDPLYKDLPVIIVKDWDQVTRENLDAWLEKYSPFFYNHSWKEKLTTRYWRRLVLEQHNECSDMRNL